jgi:GDP-4-dehydro-6-deoxy-D-mannose reductase
VIVAVTGAWGSIGRALAGFITGRGETLIQFPSRAQLDLAGCSEPLRAWLSANRPDAIIHLAGWRRGSDVATAFRDNVTATYNLLSAVALVLGRIRIVVASSAAVYGDARGRAPLSVEAERRPVDLYGVSKALQEDTCSLARASGYADICIARIFNVFGAPGDTWSVAPRLIARIGGSAEGAIVRVAHARCTRDFVHIDDVCNALVLAATRATVPPVFNVATGIETKIGDIARRISRALSRNVSLCFDTDVGASTIVESSGDPKEALQMGWTYRTISEHDIAAFSASSPAMSHARFT